MTVGEQLDVTSSAYCLAHHPCNLPVITKTIMVFSSVDDQIDVPLVSSKF